ncbi:MAG: hypothetical protein ACP5PT_00870 [Brevinematia bacterium]
MAVIDLSRAYNPYNDLINSVGTIIGGIGVPYLLNRDLINKLEDVDLGDQKDKIESLKKHLPSEVFKEDGSIDWDKAKNFKDNPAMEHLLNIRQNRLDFKDSNILKKLQILQDPSTVQSAYTVSLNPKTLEDRSKMVDILNKLAEEHPGIKSLLGVYKAEDLVTKIPKDKIFALILAAGKNILGKEDKINNNELTINNIDDTNNDSIRKFREIEAYTNTYQNPFNINENNYIPSHTFLEHLFDYKNPSNFIRNNTTIKKRKK